MHIDRLEQRHRRHVIGIVARVRAGLGRAERARRVDVGEHPHAHRTRLLDQLDRARGREIALGLAHFGQRHLDLDDAGPRHRIVGDQHVLLPHPRQAGQRPDQRAGGRLAGMIERAPRARAQRLVGFGGGGEAGRLRVLDPVDAEDRPVDHADQAGRDHAGAAGFERDDRGLDAELAAAQRLRHLGLEHRRRRIGGGDPRAGENLDIRRRRTSSG